MRQSLTAWVTTILAMVTVVTNAQTTISVPRFHKVIISPYIQATFVQGTEESVTINNILVDTGKLHVEVQGGTLRVYLEGAKDFPRNQRQYWNDGSWRNNPLYANHSVIATITYKKLTALSLRGEETYLCQSPIITKSFTLRAYGDPKVIFTEVHFGEMHTTLYGDASVDIRSGDTYRQHYTSYGDGKVNTTAMTGRSAKLTSFGETEFSLNVSNWIKITSFGEAKLRYMGNPEIVKGLHFGGVDLQRLD